MNLKDAKILQAVNLASLVDDFQPFAGAESRTERVDELMSVTL